MSFFSILILSIIFILFPIVFILILKTYNIFFNKICNEYLIDLACFIGFLLLIKYCNYTKTYELLIANIPFLILIINRRRLSSYLMAFLLIMFNYSHDYNLYLVTIEYILYLFIFFILDKKYKSYSLYLTTFLFIKGFSLTIENYYIIGNNTIAILVKIFIDLIIFYLISIVIINLTELMKNTISLNNIIRTLEKEKNLKNALFKITHEVKNPIAVCKGYLDMMDYEDKIKTEKYNKIISQELDRTLDILNNFSSYNKISISLDIIDLNILLEDVIKLTKPILKPKNINLNYINEYEEIYINGDYERLKQVLINILKNSIEASKINGNIKISVTKTKKYVTINIKDNGIGIKKEDLDKIGDLFYTSKNKGTGLGVSLSKEIIKLHEGSMKYDSKYKEYTLVTIKLPIKKI